MKRLANKLLDPSLAVLLLVIGYLAVNAPYTTAYYPYLAASTPDNLQLTFLMEAQSSRAACQQSRGGIANIIGTTCPMCKITEGKCLQHLSPEQQKILSKAPIDHFSTRLVNGVAVFFSPNAAVEQLACSESERQSLANEQSEVKCHPPGTMRPDPDEQRMSAPVVIAANAAMLALAAIISWLACYLIIRYEHLHAHLSHDPVESGPQKFHTTPTPRIGGIAIICSLLLCNVMVSALLDDLLSEQFSLLILAGLPAFAGGMIEDITKKVGVTTRLLLAMLSGATAAWLLGAILNRSGVPGLDTALVYLPLAIAFTTFAVGGITNAINIIDGYNGLASGYSIIVLTAFAIVYALLGDTFLLLACIVKIGAIAGFFFWNWPKGRIFLGDGGAYLIGFCLAEMAILGIVRHPEISPWFSVLLLTYPVYETFFSAYRKRFLRGMSPGKPDSMHLHMLIYKRVIPRTSVSTRNPLVAALILPIWIVVCILAVANSGNTSILVTLSLACCAIYTWFYWRIVRWRSPFKAPRS